MAKLASKPATKPGNKKAINNRLQVHEAANTEQRRQVLKFRNQVMVDELGICPVSSYGQQRLDHAARDKAARHLFLTSNGAVAGCLRLYTSDMIAPSPEMTSIYGLDAFADFGPEYLSFSDHMVIGERWRGSQAPALMTAAAFKLARSAGAHFDFTYCPPALVGLYEKIGYRSYSGKYLEVDEGLQVPMVLVMDDVQHLQSINSPFAPLALLKKPDPTIVRWFGGKFPEAASRPVKALRDEQNLWQYLTRQLHQNPLNGVPLFDSLSYDEAQRFLKNSTTLVLRGGDRLAKAGDISDEAFVLLSGNAEIRNRRGLVLAHFDKGAVIGEIAYLAATPRTADMVVTQDAEVLVLTQESLKKNMRTEPAIANKVLFNLTLILAERLKATSEQLSRLSPDY
ncbi:MAG: cyclic nucleotide-binding domain-containing protein [Rhodospirillaceae bacterium]|jgi:CRP-like cAMP-binding protein|nr:cyclic nucleotide-binding domain-containing protein [Rhodospirillaceae bacterium]MBT3490704.1 cyclic nucleotide-binding domain-containing protein [Rhodospirillaceae bacterium]MBT3783007.1 cyclic nucleotide-binding domain-containing protein [Rhodospirillaceae bacterium]MBT3976308.1 cyclic nucleotide-binding domain-containing protein [Rhodospirillaceae bacterium]MBT4169214.1 cyclic nucleotide-binding domain-containing protein [Rhodospirillaceae bacterium]